MKVNEIKLNEYDWMSLLRGGVNNFGGAPLRRGNTDAVARRTQQIFISDFVNSAVTGLAGAIKSGLVDMNMSADNQAAQQSQTTGAPKPRYRPSTSAPGQWDQISESKYRRLNFLFEAILNENVESIESYLTRFFTQYMRNVNIQGKESVIQQKAQEVANAIRKTQGDFRSKEVLNAINNMALLGYSLSLAGSTTGNQAAYNQPNVPQQASSRATQQAPAQAPAQAQQPAQATTPAQAPTQAASATQAQQKAFSGEMEEVKAALKSLGYKDKEIKSIMPGLAFSSGTDNMIRQALQLLQGQPSMKKTAPRRNVKPSRSRSSTAVAGKILKDLQNLEKLDPNRHAEIVKQLQNKAPQNIERPVSSNVVNLNQRR